MRLNLQTLLTDVEWEEVVALGPGVRMFRGKKTLFYNGEELWEGGHDWEDEEERPVIYDEDERDTWEVIIILPGVKSIPGDSFSRCHNVQIVIMADTVKRINFNGFLHCSSLKFVNLSRNLEFIGQIAFCGCTSLTSIFVPPSCREISDDAFCDCTNLIILSVPQHTRLGRDVISKTALIQASHFEADELQLDYLGYYHNNDQVNAWIKNINGHDDEYALHRACSSFNPIRDIVYSIVKRQGLKSFKKENEIGVTPLQYLEENPYADIDQHKLMKRYILELMGETV